MRLYHKIDNVFGRDYEGTKELIEGRWRNPAVEYLADNHWVFTEKVDGTNIRIMWDGHKVAFGGRTDRADLPKPLVKVLTEMFGSEAEEQLFEERFGEREVIFFGEGYGGRIQKAGPKYRKEESFILFDVMVDGVYMEREVVERLGEAFGCDVVPVVLEGTIHDAVEFIRQSPQSTMGDLVMEGVVGRPAVELQDKSGKRMIVKIKVADFVK